MHDAQRLDTLLDDPEVAELARDPELAPLIAQLRTGGPSALMAHMGNPKVQQLASLVMGKMGGGGGGGRR